MCITTVAIILAAIGLLSSGNFPGTSNAKNDCGCCNEHGSVGGTSDCGCGSVAGTSEREHECGCEHKCEHGSVGSVAGIFRREHCKHDHDCGHDHDAVSGASDKCCDCVCLGDNRIDDIRWRKAAQCSECELCALQEAADHGFECWRTDPVKVAANFVKTNCTFPCSIRMTPPYLKDKECCEGKVYVLLGFHSNCDVACECCQPVKKGPGGIFTVCRFACVED